MIQTFFTTHKLLSLDDTKSFARNLAKIARPRDVFCLDGPLGSGKTAFARFFVQACAEEEIEVPSPTFTLVQTYETPKGSIWHFDVYRLKDSEEVFELGLEESLAYGISIIEWAHKIEPYLPSHRLHLKFDINPAGERFLTIKPHGPSERWKERE